MNTIDRRHSLWLMKKGIDEDLKKELMEMKINRDLKEDAFYRELEFGTSGIRGVMGAGTNRINSTVVKRLTQGISEYLLARGKKPTVVISYDTRKNSKKFAEDAAETLALNRITSYIAPEPMPLAVLSYTVRRKKASLGIMITASHNSKEYNGYKVYDETGKQILKDQVKEIKKFIEKIDYFEEKKWADTIEVLDSYKKHISSEIIIEFEEAALDSANMCVPSVNCGENSEPFDENPVNEDIKIVYTPLNGTGKKITPKLLRKAGFNNVYSVEEQEVWDGEFSTCIKPNPELEEVYVKAKEVAEQVGEVDLILSNDPDADRMGMAIKVKDQYKVLNGNEIATLILNYLIAARKEIGNLPEKPTIVRTIATTPILDELIEKVGGEAKYTLIGFKYIGDKQNQMETAGELDNFILGAEEANGYLTGSYVRDKDGITAALISAMMVRYYKKQGKTLVDVLQEIYENYGYYKEKTISFNLSGQSGEKVRASLISSIKKAYLKIDFGNTACAFTDYETKTTKLMPAGAESNYPKTKKLISLPQREIIEFLLKDGKVIIRPSGTEPKLKVYLFAKGKSEEETNALLAEIEVNARKTIEKFIKENTNIIQKRLEKTAREEFYINEEIRRKEERKAQRKLNREKGESFTYGNFEGKKKFEGKNDFEERGDRGSAGKRNNNRDFNIKREKGE